MCEDCLHAYEDEIDYPGINSDHFWNESTGPRVNLDVVQEEMNSPVSIKIKTTDTKFAAKLIDFLNNCKVKENSTKVKIK